MMGFVEKIISRLLRGGDHQVASVRNDAVQSKVKLEKLNEKEIDFLKTTEEFIEQLLNDLNVDFERHRFETTRIEKTAEMWFSRDLSAVYQLEIVVISNALAVAWGNYIREKYKMSWTVITDQFGSEIGLYNDIHQLTIFPFKTVGKMFNDRNFELLTNIESGIAEVEGLT